jgi:hypothetical protein
MTHERRIEAYRIHIESGQRYDYFVTGGAGVALGYSLQQFSAASGPVGSFLLPWGWTLLLVSLAAGMWHLSESRAFLAGSYRVLDIEANIEHLQDGAAKGKIGVGKESGEVIAGSEFNTAIQAARNERNGLMTYLRELNPKLIRLGDWRDVNLVLAIALHAIWRVLNF